MTEINIPRNFSTVEKVPGRFVVPDIKPIAGDKVDTLGIGTYGEVYSTDKNLAVKENISAITDDIPTGYMVEISILNYLNHINVINLIAMQLNPIKIVMPIADYSLDKYRTYTAELPEIFYQIFRGLAYCHSKGVWHRDIKPHNILIFNTDDIPIVKLADFGLSVAYPQNKNDLDVVTVQYRSPELCLVSDRYNESIDIWATGVMFLEKFLGYNPFKTNQSVMHLYEIFDLLGTPDEQSWPGVTNLPAWYAAMDSSYKQTKNYKITSLAELKNWETYVDEKQLIDATINWPHKRLSAKDILELPYFDEIREQIEVQIPAEPIVNRSCAQMLLGHQRQILDTDSKYFNRRRKILDYLYTLCLRIPFNRRVLLYTITLLDLVDQNKNMTLLQITLFAIAALKISADLWAINVPGIYDYIYLTDNKYSAEQILDARDQILRIVDFQLIFPTCADFVYQYLSNGMEDELKDEDKFYQFKFIYDKVLHFCFVLLSHSKYVYSYTAAQIAQIAIRAANVNSVCLTNVPNLYTEDIQQYLYYYDPEDDMKFMNELYFNELRSVKEDKK